MSNYIRDKTLITRRILELIDPSYTNEKLDYCLKNWWCNIRKYGGLGLTSEGNEAFLSAELEYTDVPVKVDEAVKLATRLALDKHIPCPWFLASGGSSKAERKLFIRLYDGRVAAMAILHGGLSEYLDRLKQFK